MSEPRIMWHIEEYAYREKGADWYWAVGIIGVVGVVLAVLNDDILFAIIIVFGGSMLGYYAMRRPKVITVAIHEEGISIEDYFYPFSKIKGFNIDEHKLGSFLLIESSRAFMPVNSIPLPKTGLEYAALRDLLKTKIKEKSLKETTAHRIMDHLGF